jgi:CDP-6-deoxy-D-xylo-4-hexulose-3-dehydrase
MGIVSNFAMPVVGRDRAIFERYRQRFEQAGVEIRPIIAGDMTEQLFYKKYAVESASCPNTHCIHRQGFYFGNRADLAEEEVNFLCSLLRP